MATIGRMMQNYTNSVASGDTAAFSISIEIKLLSRIANILNSYRAAFQAMRPFISNNLENGFVTQFKNVERRFNSLSAAETKYHNVNSVIQRATARRCILVANGDTRHTFARFNPSLTVAAAAPAASRTRRPKKIQQPLHGKGRYIGDTTAAVHVPAAADMQNATHRQGDCESSTRFAPRFETDEPHKDRSDGFRLHLLAIHRRQMPKREAHPCARRQAGFS